MFEDFWYKNQMYILPGGSLSIMAYTGRLRPKVVPFKSFFMLQVYKRVGINISLLVEVFSLDNDYFLVQCIICFVGLLMASSEARLYITWQASLDCCVRICWRLREGIETTSWIKKKKNMVREPHLYKIMAFQLSVYPNQYSSDLEIGTREEKRKPRISWSY